MPTIQIIAFRGLASFKNPQYQHLPKLLLTGHVGIKFDDDQIIYGFHPSKQAEVDAGGEDKLLASLIKCIPQEGMLHDDTVIFSQAHQLSRSGERTEVWSLSQTLSKSEYQQIQETSMQ